MTTLLFQGGPFDGRVTIVDQEQIDKLVAEVKGHGCIGYKALYPHVFFCEPGGKVTVCAVTKAKRSAVYRMDGERLVFERVE